MRGAVLYGPRDAFRGARGANDSRTHGCRRQALGDLHLRLRPVAVPRHQRHRRSDADGARVLRHRRRRRPHGQVDQAWAVRHRIVCRLRQHVPALSGWLPDVVHAPAVDRRCAGADAARADGGRHARRDAGRSLVEPCSQLSGGVRRTRHRLVRGRRGECATGRDGRRGGRWCGGSARRALRAADGCRADHRDESSPGAADARTRVRGDRHRDRTRRRGRGPHQGTDARRWRRLGAGVCGHARVDDAGNPLDAARRFGRLCRRPARCRTARRSIVLLARASSWRAGAGASIPVPADRPCDDGRAQSRDGGPGGAKPPV